MTPTAPEPHHDDAVTAALPRFARTPVLAAPVGWRWWLAAALLLVVLVVQCVLADRARLAADPDWRPALERICGVLRCDLPPWHAPQAFVMSARDIRPHPSVPNALLITASFRNGAAFAQAWPQVELAMSDLDGRPIAQRRFAPREYLGGTPAQALLAPGQSASVTLEVVDPGRRAVAFEFEFH